MMSMLRRVGSPRLTTLALLLLAAGAFASIDQPEVANGYIVVPLALLAVNLAAAITCRPALRRGGLGLFHVCLLACMLLVAWGRLTHLDARVRIVGGQEFDAGAVEVDARGRWHGDGLQRLAFRQGPFTVTYGAGIKREHTTSLVALGTEPRAPWQAIGDDTPLKVDGYRFYTTPNKGFAPVLTWTPARGEPVTGAVMLPSYPVSDVQAQQWEAPGGATWNFWLRVDKAPENTAWTLDPSRTPNVLVAESGSQRFELKPGEQARIAQGTLRYEWLSGWMGYRIFYDPTLLPLLALALLAVAGLAWHLWARSLQSLAATEAVPA
jgi:hypothetical protein